MLKNHPNGFENLKVNKIYKTRGKEIRNKRNSLI
jgi:hypothetical protein